jgi:hypothetical protein
VALEVVDKTDDPKLLLAVHAPTPATYHLEEKSVAGRWTGEEHGVDVGNVDSARDHLDVDKHLRSAGSISCAKPRDYSLPICLRLTGVYGFRPDAGSLV